MKTIHGHLTSPVVPLQETLTFSFQSPDYCSLNVRLLTTSSSPRYLREGQPMTLVGELSVIPLPEDDSYLEFTAVNASYQYSLL